MSGQPIKGRGALSNRVSRFQELKREAVDDGWYPEPGQQSLPVEILTDHARSIITANDSPDVPFDRSINPYRGCAHGCIYCFARPSHAYLGFSPGLDFETRIAAKPEAAALLRQALEIKDLFEEWLQAHYPQRAAKVLSLLRQCRGGALYRNAFGERMRGAGPVADLLQRRFELCVRRLGLAPPGAGWALNCDRFIPPGGTQLSLNL